MAASCSSVPLEEVHERFVTTVAATYSGVAIEVTYLQRLGAVVRHDSLRGRTNETTNLNDHGLLGMPSCLMDEQGSWSSNSLH